LVDVLEHPALTRPELRSVLGRAGRGLAVLAARAGDAEGAEPPAGPVAPTGPVPAAARTAGRLDERGWARVVRALAEHAASVVVDCGPGLAAPGTRAAVAAADQLVLVVDARLPRAAPAAAGPLAALGRPAAVVANQAPAGLRAGEVLERVPRARGAVLLPAGAAGLGALPFGWESVPRAAWGQASRSAWRQAYELAALLVSDWPSLGLADGPVPGLADARLEDAADPPARPRQPARSGRRLPRSPEPNRGTANAQARRLE
ncbi:MAG TPA: hypothetical protein VEP73_05115, partial [Actinomycetota bacterium]|nr:hypothetical protein [Actinomycetota bacterium]